MAVNFREETGKWEVDFYVKDAGGRRKRRYKSFDKEGEAKVFQANIILKKRAGRLLAPSETLFRPFAEWYVENWKRGEIRGR